MFSLLYTAQSHLNRRGLRSFADSLRLLEEWAPSHRPPLRLNPSRRTSATNPTAEPPGNRPQVNLKSHPLELAACLVSSRGQSPFVCQGLARP